MREIFGIKDFSLKNRYSITKFDDGFKFEKNDVVVFFRSDTNPDGSTTKSIKGPKGSMKDLVVAAVHKVDHKNIVLVPADLDMIGLVKDMITKGPEAEDRSLFVDSIVLEKEIALTRLIKFPTFSYIDSDKKYILRTLDVLREGEGNGE